MTLLKSQILGLLLGLFTAIGCIFYEKLVHHFSYMTFMIILCFEVIIFIGIGYFIFPNELQTDYVKFISDSKYLWWAIGYLVTGITTIFWFIITKNQGVMVGSIYEVKYIMMLALIYIVFGDNKFTMNTGIGIVLALASIYFISKS